MIFMTDFELTKCCALYEFGCSNAAAKAVLVTLAAMTMSTGRVSGKTVDELCRACCVQRNAFLKAIAWLEEKGLIVVERHKAVASTYIFNEALLLSGGLVGSESVTKNEGYENDTKAKKVGYGFDTKLVTDTTPTQLRIRNQVSYASVTTYKKEKEKKEKGDFFEESSSLSTTVNDKPVVDFDTDFEVKTKASQLQGDTVKRNIAQHDLMPVRRRTWEEFMAEQCGIEN